MDLVSFSVIGWPKEDCTPAMEDELDMVDVCLEDGSDYHVRLDEKR